VGEFEGQTKLPTKLSIFGLDKALIYRDYGVTGFREVGIYNPARVRRFNKIPNLKIKVNISGVFYYADN